MSSTSFLDRAMKRKDFEDREILAMVGDIYHKRKKKQFSIPPPGSAVVLLLSGGLDSIGLWFMLLNKYKLAVYPLYCYLKDTENKKQRESISFFSKILNKRFPSLYHSPTQRIISNGFSFRDRKIDAKKNMSLIIPNLYKAQYGGIRAAVINNPTRIFEYISQAITLLLRLRYQKNTDATTIFTGYIPEDGKATREPTLTVLRVMNLLLSLILGDFNYQIMAPIDKKSNFYFTKGELLRYASENGISMERTWSCLKDGESHCGVCTSCRMRKDAYKNSGIIDGTKYSSGLNTAPSLIRKFIKRLSIRVGSSVAQSFNSPKKHLSISVNSRIAIDPHIDWEIIDKEVYRFHRTTGTIDCLNVVGSYIWKEISLSPHISIKQLSSMVVENFKIQKNKKIIKDIIPFIKTNIKEGYLSQ